jgi:hypothetical protein
VAIEVKPCQDLNTSQEIIFFNIPFCLAQGLRNLIRKAMVEQKLLLIKRDPAKWPRMEWGWHLLDFEMVQDFVQNTTWRYCKKKTTILAYHKHVWQLKYPSAEVD